MCSTIDVVRLTEMYWCCADCVPPNVRAPQRRWAPLCVAMGLMLAALIALSENASGRSLTSTHGLLKWLWHCQAGRYFHYFDFLRERKDLYHQVLITDVRDVIFQDNPFRSSPEDEFSSFEEYGICLKDEPYNSCGLEPCTATRRWQSWVTAGVSVPGCRSSGGDLCVG